MSQTHQINGYFKNIVLKASNSARESARRSGIVEFTKAAVAVAMHIGSEHGCSGSQQRHNFPRDACYTKLYTSGISRKAKRALPPIDHALKPRPRRGLIELLQQAVVVIRIRSRSHHPFRQWILQSTCVSHRSNHDVFLRSSYGSPSWYTDSPETNKAH